MTHSLASSHEQAKPLLQSCLQQQQQQQKSKAKANIAIKINKQYIVQTCTVNSTLYKIVFFLTHAQEQDLKKKSKGRTRNQTVFMSHCVRD